MKKKNSVAYYLYSPDATITERIRIPKYVIFLVVTVFLISLAGFYRTVSIFYNYAYARFGLINERNENKALLQKLLFLNKYTETYGKRIKELIAFEDKTRLKFGMNTINEDIRLVGIGGSPSLDRYAKSLLADPMIRKAEILERKIETILRQITLQDTTFSRLSNHVAMQHDRWAQRPSIWPAKGRITSSFGFRIHPFEGVKKFHDGLDIANNIWTPVYVTADGIVDYVGFRGYYGTTVAIDHRGSSYSTVYAHLQESAVKEGQVVKRGELIGYLGNSGRSTGSHLHYEVLKFGRHENPINYILPTDMVID